MGLTPTILICTTRRSNLSLNGAQVSSFRTKRKMEPPVVAGEVVVDRFKSCNEFVQMTGRVFVRKRTVDVHFKGRELSP